ncbi:MAG: SH3 domain-containing protein [Erythrobacter sp.]
MTSIRPLFALILAGLTFGVLVPVAGAAPDSEPPYWASMKFNEVRMRVGPSREYPIEWVYVRARLPVKVMRTLDGWWLVEDPDGDQGWIASSQLSLTRSAIVVGEGAVIIREGPDAKSALRWRAEPGVVGDLLQCRDDWCQVDISGRSGWIPAGRLWGDEELAAAAD